MRYRDAGVDIDRANDIVRGIARLAPSTWGPQVLSDIGSFGGLFATDALGPETVLVASMDGVGTKLAVARAAAAEGEQKEDHSKDKVPGLRAQEHVRHVPGQRYPGVRRCRRAC